MKLEKISQIKDGRQDGAIYNGFLFSFNHRGVCSVYELSALENGKSDVFAEFVLDRNDELVPHSNSVTFGNEFYDENDEFPLLYTNIYNNYCSNEDKLTGVCLVYRLQRSGKEFKTNLVQMIEIGFTEDTSLWKSEGENSDLRPYGNFVVDTKKSILYAFTMRDNTHTTRYFAFNLPKANEGIMCEKYKVKKVILNECDILEHFDLDYHYFMQGACYNDGKIYSTEGFTDNDQRPPAIRIVDLELKKEICFKLFKELGSNVEPELIDFENGTCYYVDHFGNVYKLLF